MDTIIFSLRFPHFPLRVSVFPTVTLFLQVFKFGDHSFITYSKFSKKLTFLTPWCAHVRIFKCFSFSENCAYVPNARVFQVLPQTCRQQKQIMNYHEEWKAQKLYTLSSKPNTSKPWHMTTVCASSFVYVYQTWRCGFKPSYLLFPMKNITQNW